MWSTFLSRHDLLNKDKLPSKLDNPALKKALNVLEIMNFTDDERMAYEDRLKWLMVESNTLRKYEEKGFERGLEEGREEARQEKIEMAKMLLLQGVDIDMIAKATKLSQEELKKFLP